MKNHSIPSRLFRGFVTIAAVGAIGLSTSCMTTYDAAGRPVQSVDPGAAVAGAAAAGILGYALANNNDNHYYHNNRYYGHRPRRSYYRY